MAWKSILQVAKRFLRHTGPLLLRLINHYSAVCFILIIGLGARGLPIHGNGWVLLRIAFNLDFFSDRCSAIQGVLFQMDELLARRIEEIAGLLHVKIIDVVRRWPTQVNCIAKRFCLRVGSLQTSLLRRLDTLLFF
jgi:hypothetical protein